MKNKIMIGAALAALILGAGAYADQPILSPQDDFQQKMQRFAVIYYRVQQIYVVKPDSSKMMDAALRGMLSSLDPHSTYLDKDDFKDLKETTTGIYGGLGIEVMPEDGAVKIVTPMDDTPAFRAGLQSGDYITGIDGKSIIGTRLSDAIKKMKGEAGTTIKLTIFRPSLKDSFDIELKRELITVKSVKSRREGDYGVLRISRFNEKTAEDTKDALKQLTKGPNPIKGLVLDLRNNPGGVLQASVCVSDLFLSKGEVVSQRDRDDKNIIRYRAESLECKAGGDVLNKLPIVVLINNGSASAAEIVAGALKDHKRASLVGLTSFGKGSVQSVLPLDQDTAVKITTARYFTPSGQSIQKIGIEPDLEVAQSKEQAKFIATSAKQYSEASLENALNASEGRARRAEHAVSEVPPDDYNVKDGDFQLLRALDLLALNGDVALAKQKPRGKTYADSELIDKPGSKFMKPEQGSEASSAASSSASSSSVTPAK